MSTALTPDEKQEVFGSFDPDIHNEEVKSRWGNTDAYKQSAKKTASYSKEDFAQMNLESDFIVQTFKNLMEKETSPESNDAKETAEAHRQHITKWFYDCTYEIHANLALMYLMDERFKENYEKQAIGLTRYIHDAIIANSVDNI
jgi:MerR family transcriptional regulator, thiopeptide resistance regulator